MKLLILILGYLFGSFPSGYLVGKIAKGIDIRSLGSGSTGATNVLRQVGKRAAITVFLLDVFKGVLSILLAKYLLKKTRSPFLSDGSIETPETMAVFRNPNRLKIISLSLF